MDASALAMDFSVKPVAFDVEQSAALGSAAPVDTSAAQALRVAHLFNQEVVMIRQSGANSLAVSLKLDPHTELFLQLTNHDGQIQASIRCERGNLAGLGGHWGELRESLARQNVQLLPLENKMAPPHVRLQRRRFRLPPPALSINPRKTPVSSRANSPRICPPSSPLSPSITPPLPTQNPALPAPKAGNPGPKLCHLSAPPAPLRGNP